MAHATPDTTGNLDTFDTVINLEDVVVGVYLKPSYFVEREEERASYAAGVGADGCRFNYMDMWKDCWCLKPYSVRSVWETYQKLRRHVLPAAVAARKAAYWRREEEHEESLRGHVAKRYRIELPGRAPADPERAPSARHAVDDPHLQPNRPGAARAEAVFNDARTAELQIRTHTAQTLALHTALELGHEAAHGKQVSYLPLTALERRNCAWARNELTRTRSGVNDEDLIR